MLITFISFSSCVTEQNNQLIISEQGSFAVGGTVISNPGTFDPYNPTPEGQTYHGDHAYVFYQIPANARKYPLVMWHGLGQFSKTWETTPDGRVGIKGNTHFPFPDLNNVEIADLMSEWLKEKGLD